MNKRHPARKPLNGPSVSFTSSEPVAPDGLLDAAASAIDGADAIQIDVRAVAAPLSVAGEEDPGAALDLLD